MAQIPCITLWQPWASLVAIGAKRFEFRSWAAPSRLVGQRVAIHAGARATSKTEVHDLLLKLQSSFWRETCLERAPAIKLLEAALITPGILPRSSVLCTATLGVPIRDADLEREIGLPALNDSDREQHTNYGWPLAGVRPLEPIVPARGFQGWWNLELSAEAVTNGPV